MGGMITTNPDFNLDEILPKLKEYTVTDAVKTVSRTEKNISMEMDLKLHY